MLPKLCYLGSLNVEATSAGPAQLYRLLLGYPADRLHIVEADGGAPDVRRRLAGVNYSTLNPAFRRGWFYTRNHAPRLYWSALNIHAWWQARKALQLMAPFRPDAVVTVHDGFGWLTAAALAQQADVPLHLILHDEWYRDVPMAKVLKPKFEEKFALVYRRAASRLCISPYMEEDYAGRYGARGTVLYPSRDPDAPAPEAPPPQLSKPGEPLRVGYAGNIWHRGNWTALRELATVLEAMNGKLIIFGPTTAADAAQNGLARSNVFVRGFVDNLNFRLREEALAVFVPMTFEMQEKRNMQLSFPSKIADYAAAGLPLVIYGPAYSSAVRWANERSNIAEVVTEEGLGGLTQGLENLLDPRRRETLGRAALTSAAREFSPHSVRQVFFDALAGGSRS